MAEDLNHFAKYQTYSSYSTIYQELDTPNKTQTLRRNPLEYYTKRGLDPPKTIYGDPAQILDPQIPQKQDQHKEENTVGSVHHFASEIDRLCLEVGKILQKPQSIKDQLNNKKKKPQEQNQDYPSNDMHIQSLKQIKSFNEFNPSIQQYNTQQLLHEQQQEQRQVKVDQSIKANYQKQGLQLELSPQNYQTDPQLQQKRDEYLFQNQKKSVQQLYQRNHKAVLAVDEEQKKMKQNQRSQGGSLTELAQHQDEEIQRAIRVLQGGQKKT
ncbi:unnamed protein product [Paramecium pentaurelia]|uniref:Uncharacterized protein n=1 Tax=Paramecium pentaurelia TaxID=43138 RepID=A0A8S1U0D2_9CILI|nr:unnamed protein product [Paramecium pentaurelia]